MVQNVFTVRQDRRAARADRRAASWWAAIPAAVASNFTGFWRNADWSFDTVRLVGVAMVGSLFSSDAWNNVTFTAGEVRNPQRNLPLSLALGVLHRLGALPRLASSST